MKNVNKILWANESTDKNCYPYSWVTSVKRFQEKKFPSIDDFESDLTGKVRQEDYEYSNSLYNANCRTFADWHVHYLEMDVLILLNGLVFWQETIHREFGNYSYHLCTRQSLPRDRPGRPVKSWRTVFRKWAMKWRYGEKPGKKSCYRCFQLPQR